MDKALERKKLSELRKEEMENHSRHIVSKGVKTVI
jgi:hypothetical protein